MALKNNLLFVVCLGHSKHVAILPSMASSFTLHSLDEPEQKTKGEFLVTLPTNAPLPHESTVSQVSLSLSLSLSIYLYLLSSFFFLFSLDFPTTTFGDKLRGQVEERLVFYETGEPPKRNSEVMQAALAEVQLQKDTATSADAMSTL